MKWSEIEQEYEDYLPHFNKIDSEVVNEFRCESCGGPLTYRGFKSGIKSGSSYVAFSICADCGEAMEF